MSGISRREWIAAFLGSQVAATVGCSLQRLPPQGTLRTSNFQIGHQIRDGVVPKEAESRTETTPVTIVGGGIAGLSAAWRLMHAGMNDFVLLELETRAGGTARGGSTGSMNYPWGAHYLPVPMAENDALIRLLEEMDVVRGRQDDGSPIVGEQYLCRDPEERLFFQGVWQEGLYPREDATEDDLSQLSAFRAEIDRWVDARDEQGRRMFAIPVAQGSDSDEVRELDQLSMAHWMDSHGWDSQRLRWLVDYACRDDYGLSLDRTSAWAGVFYFASRVRAAGNESQSVITWPEGNGRVVDFLADRIGNRIRSGQAVVEIDIANGEHNDGGATVVAIDTQTQQRVALQAEQVIFSAPQMLAKHLIRDVGNQPADLGRPTFQYGSWLVANVHLSERPNEKSFPMCWDNVIHPSRSLGYVTSTHQQGIDHGPTVLTWYYPFADVDPKITRQQMLRSPWSDWADLVMTDLRLAHHDIDNLVTRIDVMLWGHAMIQPVVGFVWSDSRLNASKPYECVHFAGSDLSGIALMEEAFYHGVRAAEEVLSRRNHPFQTWLSAAGSQAT